MKARPVVIVLAAGQGSRFGGRAHKLGQTLGNSSVLGEVLRHAVASHLPVVVVTTDMMAEEARRTIASRDVLILSAEAPGDAKRAPSWGIGHSIASGVAARPDASGWLILPADMPLVQAATSGARRAAARPSSGGVCAIPRPPRPPGRLSSPSCTPSSRLQGDEGARRLVARYPAHAVEVDDPGVLIDIDTEADLIAARSAHASRGASALDSNR